MTTQRKIQLSSSDGTRLTVEGIIQAKLLIKNARVRLMEINDGRYKPNQPPIEFNADTSQELLDAVYYLQREVNWLVDYLID